MSLLRNIALAGGLALGAAGCDACVDHTEEFISTNVKGAYVEYLPIEDLKK